MLLEIGEVERGLAYMRQLEGSELRWFGTILSTVNRGLPEEVVVDSRYVAALEELGVGASWREYLIEKVKEMEPLTGIGYPAETSVSMAEIYNIIDED